MALLLSAGASIDDLSAVERAAFYWYSCGVFAALCVLLVLLRTRRYLLVYLLMMGADWLQGPYVFALYSSYGFDKADIGALFIAGFASSMLFGTVVGSAADKLGRKKMCVLYGLLYSASCVTKHIPSFGALLLGRVLSGISTSILFSAFETWMVAEHHAANYPPEWIGLTFSICTTGNGIVAVAAGVVASVARDEFGPVAPFDLSLVCLLIGSAIVAATWNENTGDATSNVTATMAHAWTKLRQDPKIAYLGVIQSFFESAMYIFVFMWTPALEAVSPWTGRIISHGWIFAGFMICVLMGSSLFEYFLSHSYSVERTTLCMIAVSCASLLVSALVPHHAARLASFCVFEVCVGLFWPSLAYLRAQYVPEECRATTMNLFRVPLNCIVVLVLANIAKLDDLQVFMLCVAVLLPALACQWALLTKVDQERGQTTAYARVSAESSDVELVQHADAEVPAH